LYYNWKTETFIKATESDYNFEFLNLKKWNRPQEDLWKVGDKYKLREDSTNKDFHFEVEAYPNKDENGLGTGNIEYKFTLTVKS